MKQPIHKKGNQMRTIIHIDANYITDWMIEYPNHPMFSAIFRVHSHFGVLINYDHG